MIKAVFDTNVIVSGLIASSGATYEVFEAWRQGDIILVTSGAIVREVARVLRRPFFRDKRHIDEEDIVRIARALTLGAHFVQPEIHLQVVEDDPNDDRILECAVAGGADYVVSGDHHLLDLGRYRDIRIVTARQFLSIREQDTTAE